MDIFKLIKNKNSGQIIVIMPLLFGVLLLMGSLSTDVGELYNTKAKLSMAADAAALAAALELPSESNASSQAIYYATTNGFDPNENDISVTAELNPDGGNPNWYRVTVSKDVPLKFARILGRETITLSASATAEYTSFQPISIFGASDYGLPDVQALEIHGPYGRYDYGDPYSTLYLGGAYDYEDNPLYDSGGYNYVFNVPSNYNSINGTNTVELEIYDPALYKGSGSIDERYSAHGKSYSQNVTEYSIYAPDDTPNDYSDDVLIGTQTYSATYDSSLKEEWVSTFSFDSGTYGTGDYRVNVTSTDGAGGNVYHLRGGPPREGGGGQWVWRRVGRRWRRVWEETEGEFDPNNGTSIAATDHLEIFFTSSGTAEFVIGTIPADAAGTVAHLRNFDTDVGAKSVHYFDDTGMLNWYGTLSSNGTWAEETFTIPEGYTGGTLTATYTASANDTSVWEMWYEGSVEGTQSSQVKLVE